MNDRDPATGLTWRVHLARQQPQRAAAAAAMIALATVAAGVALGNFFWPLLVCLCLTASLHDFFLPMRYAVTEAGVEARGWLSHHALEWERVRRFYVLPDGVKVSPLAGPSRLEAYRGVFLRCTGEVQDRVVETLRMKLDVE